MGWEMWFKTGTAFGAVLSDRMGFFCNTGDSSFGPVFYIGKGWDEHEAIYTFMMKWQSEGWAGPRGMAAHDEATNSQTLWDAVEGIAEYMRKKSPGDYQ